MNWDKWLVMGTDLNGRKCPVASVAVPYYVSNRGMSRVLHYIQNIERTGPNGEYRPYAAVSEIVKEK